jgi:hypothetical protein
MKDTTLDFYLYNSTKADNCIATLFQHNLKFLSSQFSHIIRQVTPHIARFGGKSRVKAGLSGIPGSSAFTNSLQIVLKCCDLFNNKQDWKIKTWWSRG